MPVDWRSCGCLAALALAVLTLSAFLNIQSGITASSVLWLIFMLSLDASVIAIWVKLRQRQAATEAHLRAIEHQRSFEIAPYHFMSPSEFEHALGYLCVRDGCRDVQVVGGAGDLGADVIATSPDGRRIVIQAKRYGPTSKVSGPDLQRFGGTCYSVHGAQVAAVVTTSVFTRQAVQYAGHMGIGLYDEDALAGWVSRTGPAPWN